MISQPWKHKPHRSIKEQALIYAQQRFWYVFPSPPGGEKMGLVSADTSNGNRWGSTIDAKEIEDYFTRWPNANISIATGVNSKIFVLDADTVEGHGVDGIGLLKQIQAENGILPTTLIAKSPTGSLHYYFNYPFDQSVRMQPHLVKKGIDVKAEGGMVVAPPSIRPGVGDYTWLNDNAVADAPQWLLDMIILPDMERRQARAETFEAEADIGDLQLAMSAIPHNDDTWSTWNRIGMALWRASAGEAFALFDEWSKQWPGYNARNTRQRWKSYERSRPTELGAGTIFYLAHLANPDWRQLNTPENEAEVRRVLNGEPMPGPGKGNDQINRISQTKTSIIVSASAIVAQPKDWIWEGHLLRGSQELMTGMPGLGKSQVQISFIASITAGLPWPDGSTPKILGDVVMLTAEDNLAQEVIPRLIAAGAARERVHILKVIRNRGKDRQFLLAEDLDELERKLTTDLPNVQLITIDPLTAYMGGKMDSHKATEVRSQLGPLKDFAERTNIAVSTITHPAKAAGPRAIDQFIGSQAFIAAGRIGHVCVEEMSIEEDGEKSVPTGRVLFTHAKHNASKRMCTWAFEVEEIGLGEGITAPHVLWSPEPVELTADQAVATASGLESGDQRQKRQIVLLAWLTDKLQKGPILVKEIEREASILGFNQRQLRRAKDKLALRPVKNGFGDNGEWSWELNTWRMTVK